MAHGRQLCPPRAHGALQKQPSKQKHAGPPDPNEKGQKGGWKGRNGGESDLSLSTTDSTKTCGWTLGRTQEPGVPWESHRGKESTWQVGLGGGRQFRFWDQIAWIQTLALPLWGCVTLGMLLGTFVLWRPIPKTGTPALPLARIGDAEENS